MGGSTIVDKLQAVFDNLARLGSALHEGSSRLNELASLRLPTKPEVASEAFLRMQSESVSLRERIGQILATARMTGLVMFTSGMFTDTA